MAPRAADHGCVKLIPDSWMEIVINEGRNRQVRRMTAAVNLPTLRLVRAKVGDWTLEGLNPGEHTELRMPSLPTPSLAIKYANDQHADANRPRQEDVSVPDKIHLTVATVIEKDSIRF